MARVKKTKSGFSSDFGDFILKISICVQNFDTCQETDTYINILCSEGTSPADFSTKGTRPPSPAFDAPAQYLSLLAVDAIDDVVLLA